MSRACIVRPNLYSARALRLQEHVQAFAHARFEWGRFDCCTWAADWVAAEHGADPMESLRGLDHALQAARQIRRLGGLHQAICARLGAGQPALRAQMGDIVLMPTLRGSQRQQRGLISDALGLSVGICLGDHVAVPALVGLAYVPLAWRSAGCDVYQASGVAAWRV